MIKLEIAEKLHISLRKKYFGFYDDTFQKAEQGWSYH